MRAGRPRRARPATARRGARGGGPRAQTLINWSLYRVGWLVVLVPALIVLIGARTPAALPPAPLPETFDGAAALAAAGDVSSRFADRSPGSVGDGLAADWVDANLRATGLGVYRQRFSASDAQGRRVAMQNVVAVARGQTPDAIVVLAARDGVSPGPSANDDASGTGALVELARTLAGTSSQKTLVLASTDGGTAGDAGARELAAHPPPGTRPVAVLALRGIGRPGALRLRIEGDGIRRPAAGLVRSVQQQLADHGLSDVQVPTLGEQAASLLAPLGRGPQSAFVARGVPAVALDGSDPSAVGAADTVAGLSVTRLDRVGSTVQALVLAADSAAPPESPASSYLLSGGRVVRGWTLQLLLVALVLPPALALLDLATRTARRGHAASGVLHAVSSHLWAPLTFVAVLRLEGLLGAVPDVHSPPFAGAGIGLLQLGVPLLAAVAVALWTRRRRRPATGDPAQTGVLGYLAAFATVAAAIVLALLRNPYDLVLLLPALHLWLLLPYVQGRGVVVRIGVVVLGWLGVLWLVLLLALSAGLGLSAVPWILREAATGSIPFLVSIAVALLWAASALLVSIVTARYAAAET